MVFIFVKCLVIFDDVLLLSWLVLLMDKFFVLFVKIFIRFWCWVYLKIKIEIVGEWCKNVISRVLMIFEYWKYKVEIVNSEYFNFLMRKIN